MLTTKIKKYKTKFSKRLESDYLKQYNGTKLYDILQYSLDGGKRLRPIIVDEITKKLNKLNSTHIDCSHLSIMVELIHSASLLIDDLPSMDNDDERRGKLTFHKKYNVLGAHVISSLLISDSYDMIDKLYTYLEDLNIYDKNECEQRILAIYNNILNNLGEDGIIMGQYIDLLPLYSIEFGSIISDELDNYKNEKLLKVLIHKKTTVLFEISFITAYIVAGGDLKKINRLKQAVSYFGLAFQISDDFLDEEQDKNRTVKDLTPNYVINFGREHSRFVLKESVYEFRKIMTELGLWSRLFNDVSLFLIKRIE